MASYFKSVYDVDIEYPCLPIVLLQGYFPLEFLYQEQGRVGGAQDSNMKGAVLKYHDEYAGYDRAIRIEQVKKLAYDEAVNQDAPFKNLRGLLKKFQIEIEDHPKVTQSKQLQAPAIEFNKALRYPRQETKNGSWNLAEKEFACAAELTMPVILDFTMSSGTSIAKMMKELLDNMRNHGITVCNMCRINNMGINGAPDLEKKIHKFEYDITDTEKVKMKKKHESGLV